MVVLLLITEAATLMLFVDERPTTQPSLSWPARRRTTHVATNSLGSRRPSGPPVHRRRQHFIVIVIIRQPTGRRSGWIRSGMDAAADLGRRRDMDGLAGRPPSARRRPSAPRQPPDRETEQQQRRRRRHGCANRIVFTFNSSSTSRAGRSS